MSRRVGWNDKVNKPLIIDNPIIDSIIIGGIINFFMCQANGKFNGALREGAAANGSHDLLIDFCVKNRFKCLQLPMAAGFYVAILLLTPTLDGRGESRKLRRLREDSFSLFAFLEQ